MNSRLLASLGALAAAAAVLVPAQAASAATPVEDCLAARPTAVTATAVTDGNDLVCLGPDDARVPSAGDDTYLWVGEEAAGDLRPSTDADGKPTIVEPGFDTLSLELWQGGWNQGAHMFGERVFIDVDSLVMTEHDDSFGDPAGCGHLSGPLGPEFHTLGGNDTIECILSDVSTGDGDDTVTGVARDPQFTTPDSPQPTVNTGAGNDLVDGDSDPDVVTLGAGDDVARMLRGGVDTVFGGPGVDRVFASSNDVLFSAKMVATAPAPAPAPAPVARPAATSSQRCVRHATVRTVHLRNGASTRAVAYRLAVRRSGATSHRVVRVPAGAHVTRLVAAKGAHRAAHVTVRATGRVLLSKDVRGRVCA